MTSIGSCLHPTAPPYRRRFRRTATPSRATTLCEHLLDLIGEQVPGSPQLVELGQLAPQLAGALWRSQLPETVERQLLAVEQADVLVVATPVYRGSYTGLFKHFFDFIDQDALVDTPSCWPPPAAASATRW